VALRGSPELRRRLKAIKTVYKPAGKEWLGVAIPEARRQLARSVDTGKTMASVRKKNQSMLKVSIQGRYPVNFIDAGTKAHDIKAKNAETLKFNIGGQAFFRKKVHKRAVPARPFKAAVGEAAWREVDLIRDLVELWNKAA
jgi:hypothetical protein